MRSVPRVVTLVLLGLGVALSLVGMIAILVQRRSVPTEAEVRAWSALERGIALVVHSRLGPYAAVGLGGGAVVGGALLYLALRRTSWAMLVIAIAAVGAIGVVWVGQGGVERMEDPRYRDESRYVHAATKVAWAGTAYFAALAVAAGAAYAVARRSSLRVAEPAGTLPSSGAA